MLCGFEVTQQCDGQCNCKVIEDINEWKQQCGCKVNIGNQWKQQCSCKVNIGNQCKQQNDIQCDYRVTNNNQCIQECV
jgi:hypothetical protein